MYSPLPYDFFFVLRNLTRAYIRRLCVIGEFFFRTVTEAFCTPNLYLSIVDLQLAEVCEILVTFLCFRIHHFGDGIDASCSSPLLRFETLHGQIYTL